MFKKQTVLSLFFLFSALAGFSNFRLFPGYYVTLQGDSIHCNIEFTDWNLNPKTIRVEVNSKKMEFTPHDIRGFGVDGYDDYLSATVQFHTAPISGKDVPSQFSDSVSTKTFFLKILDRGYYSLYDLVSAERVYLFMQGKDSSISELVYRARSSNDSLFADPQYKNVILSLFVQEGLGDKYFNRVSNTSYTASDIQSLFKMLNESHGGVSYHKKSKQDFQIQLYVGGIRNAFPTPVAGNSKSYQFDPSWSMTGGINLLYSIPGKFNAFKVGLSAGYNSYNLDLKAHTTSSFHESNAYYGSSIIDDTLTTKNSLIQTSFYLMYLVNPLSSVKCYLKAGLNFNFSLNTDNSVDESYTQTSMIVRNGNPPAESIWQNSGPIIQLKKKYLAPMFGVGMTYGRSTLEFSYYMSADIGSEPNDAFADSGPSFKISSMSLSYYFSVFRTK
jgi:hypothetical protein